MDRINARKKTEYRKLIYLTEWSTKLIAGTVAAAAGEGGDKAAQKIAEQKFPWEGDPETLQQSAGDFDPDDMSFLETGDLSAADKNAGKSLPSFPGMR